MTRSLLTTYLTTNLNMNEKPSDSFIIRTDGTVQAMPPPGGPDGESFTLDQCQEAVGGLVELLPVHSVLLPERLIAVVNEEGLMLRLPRNGLATLLLGSLGASIHGDVVLMPSKRFE